MPPPPPREQNYRQTGLKTLPSRKLRTYAVKSKGKTQGISSFSEWQPLMVVLSVLCVVKEELRMLSTVLALKPTVAMSRNLPEGCAVMPLNYTTVVPTFLGLRQQK